MDLINARENFKDLPNGKTALRVFGGGLLAGVEWDDLTIAYPSDTTEQYEYSLQSVVQITILVTYENVLKNKLTRVQKV